MKYSEHNIVVSIIITSLVGSAEGFWVNRTQEKSRLWGTLHPRAGREPGARNGVRQRPAGEGWLVGDAASSPSISRAHVDTPNIVVPPEVMAGTEVEVSCMVPDNCPELHPELSWLGHEGLGEPTVLGRLREEEGTWVQVSLLHFVPTRETNGHRLGCQASFPNTTLQFEGYASLDIKCEPGCGPGAGRSGAGSGSGRGRGQGRGREMRERPLKSCVLPPHRRPPGDRGDKLHGGGHRGLPRQPVLRGRQQPAAVADLDAGWHGAPRGRGREPVP